MRVKTVEDKNTKYKITTILALVKEDDGKEVQQTENDDT